MEATPNVLWIANIFLMLIILIKAKFSYFSMKILTINYVLFAVFFQYNMGKSYGILEISPFKLHYFEINLFICIYNIITLIWISCTKVLKRENDLLNSNYEVGNLATYFCCFVAILTAIIAFPGMPFDSSYLENRFVRFIARKCLESFFYCVFIIYIT